MRATLGGSLAIALAWAVFGGVHSLLAREGAKRGAERLLGPALFAGTYRLLYNLTAAVLLVWLWLLPRSLAGDVPLAALPEPLRPLPYLLKAGAAALAALAFRQIRLGEFLGLSQFSRLTRGEMKDRSPAPPGSPPPVQALEPLACRGVYLWVRHPLNTATFIWIWAQPAYSLYDVLFAAMLTAYILIANAFEERDLLQRYGPAYAHYREIVPAFFGGVRGLRGRRERIGRPLAGGGPGKRPHPGKSPEQG